MSNDKRSTELVFRILNTSPLNETQEFFVSSKVRILEMFTLDNDDMTSFTLKCSSFVISKEDNLVRTVKAPVEILRNPLFISTSFVILFLVKLSNVSFVNSRNTLFVIINFVIYGGRGGIKGAPVQFT